MQAVALLSANDGALPRSRTERMTRLLRPATIPICPARRTTTKEVEQAKRMGDKPARSVVYSGGGRENRTPLVAELARPRRFPNTAPIFFNDVEQVLETGPALHRTFCLLNDLFNRRRQEVTNLFLRYVRTYANDHEFILSSYTLRCTGL